MISLSVPVFLVSCSKAAGDDMEKAGVLRQEVLDCRMEMTSSSDKISYDDARRMKDQALKAAAGLKKLAKNSGDRAVAETLKGLDADLLAITDVEELALCRRKLAERLDALTLSSYINSRGMMISALMKVLKVGVLAAAELPENIPSGREDAFSDAVNHVALCGRTIAEFLTKSKYSNDKDGRDRIAADLDAIAAKPPPELNLFLSLVYLVSCQDDLALFEIEHCNPSAFQDTNYLSITDKLMFYHMIRGWVLNANGWGPLSTAEFAALEKMMAVENESAPASDPAARSRTLSFWHLYLAYHYCYEEFDMVKMDQNLSWLIRLNPDSEFVVFVTGQKKADDGSFISSENSMERDFAGTEDEAVVKVFAARVRAIRDSAKVEPPPRIATSPGFLFRLSLTIAVKYAKKIAEYGPFHRLSVSIRDFLKLKKADGKSSEPVKTENMQSVKTAEDEMKN